MITLNFQNVMADSIGEKDGITIDELNYEIKKTEHFIKQLSEEKAKGKLVFADLPYQDDVASKIVTFANENLGIFKNFIHIGIGGSALGGIAIHTALTYPLYNQIASKDRGYFPKIYFFDNIDPEVFKAIMEYVDPRETLFHFVTKSGETIETLAGFLIIIKWLKDISSKNYKQNIIITTDREKGFLRKFINSEGITSFEIPTDVGGRFSALSPVGLVPAAFSGIDINRLLSGARLIDKNCFLEEPQENIAYKCALVNFLLDTKKGKHILVTMPYSNALLKIADWFRQLWAESLGKKFSLDGTIVYSGQTPVNALGVTDQHSQIQLYNEGPNDKVIVFLEVEKFRGDIEIPKVFDKEDSVEFLEGKKLSELMIKEKYGTEVSLVENKRPNYTIKMSEISPQVIGGLLYMFEVETVFAGKFYNVNPFDQPGVDRGKKATYTLLGKKGYK